MARVSEAKRVEYRERLLAAAAEAFAENGVGGARIDDISLAAGLAKGTVYNYFDSKEDLFREVLTAWSERVTASRTPVDDDSSIEDQLRSIVAADMAVMAELEAFARAAFREVLRASAGEVADLLPISDPLDAALQDVLSSGVRRRELRSDRSVEDHVRLFSAGVNGLLIERWMSGGALALDDIVRLSVDQFMNGAKA